MESVWVAFRCAVPSDRSLGLEWRASLWTRPKAASRGTRATWRWVSLLGGLVFVASATPLEPKCWVFFGKKGKEACVWFHNHVLWRAGFSVFSVLWNVLESSYGEACVAVWLLTLSSMKYWELAAESRSATIKVENFLPFPCSLKNVFIA